MAKDTLKAIDIPFPSRGVHRGTAAADQPPLTSPDMLNMRVQSLNDRDGGGKRHGFGKAFFDTVASRVLGLCTWRISQDAASIDPGEDPGPGPAPIEWVSIGVLDSTVFDIEAGLDDPSDIFVIGRFTTSGGNANGDVVALYDPATNTWTAFNSGGALFTNGPNQAVCHFCRGVIDGLTRIFFGVQVGHTANQDMYAWNGTGTAAADFPSLAGGNNGANIACAELHNSGGGIALYVGGAFAAFGVGAIDRVALFNGNVAAPAWSQGGTGITNGTVLVLRSLNDGSGQQLFAGGSFTAGGTRLAKLTGAAWANFGGGIGNGEVHALREFGGKLYVGGTFQGRGAATATDNEAYISSYDFATATWSAMQNGLRRDGFSALGAGAVHEIIVYNDGSGDAIYAVGEITAASTADGVGISIAGIAKWNGTEWSAPPRGVMGAALTLKAAGDGFASKLFIGGSFLVSNVKPCNGLAVWDGSEWSAFGGAGYWANSSSPELRCCLEATIGSDTESRLYAGGSGGTPRFGFGPGEVSNLLARWDGSAWSGLSTGIAASASNKVNALCAWDDGGGTDLYVGGAVFTSPGNRVARWNGSAWSVLGIGANNGVNGDVNAICAFDDGGGEDLYLGGSFTTSTDGSASGATRNRIVRYTASTNVFSSLTSGADTGLNGTVNALTVFGALLIAGGSFTQTQGGAVTNLNRVASYNGATMAVLGSGFTSGQVNALAVYNGELYAAGTFTASGATTTTRIARYDGANWQPLTGPSGEGVNGTVTALWVHGGKLYVGGTFTAAGGVTAYSIAAWDGAAWEAVDESTSTRPGLLNNNANFRADVLGIGDFRGDLVAVGTMVSSGGDGPAYIAEGRA